MNEKQSKVKDLLDAIKAYEALEILNEIAWEQEILFEGDEEKNKELEKLCKEALLSVYDLVANYVNV